MKILLVNPAYALLFLVSFGCTSRMFCLIRSCSHVVDNATTLPYRFTARQGMECFWIFVFLFKKKMLQNYIHFIKRDWYQYHPSIIQYVPNQHTKWGIQIWFCCDMRLEIFTCLMYTLERILLPYLITVRHMM